ncbi:AEC family transporter [Roseospira visakhapatnamensis]|uniref:AEC family transporter n=1 Tax=Roseospira visakhapatnamensis TaxID=390880 RepID=A0A7W6RCP2_9PROT|nr:AEC family transporter [Roseospira visakhapatnamensis]MBB4266003.1 hypothetical protein [Roseospira visakhapatnamensis]
MTDTLTAILPVFLVILLGHALRRARFVPDAFWVAAEKLTYLITFPALLTANLARADMGTVAWGPLMAVQGIAVLAVAALTMRLRPRLGRTLGLSDPGFTSVFQGAIRPNTYVGLAVAAALFGPAGVTLTAICIAAVIPLVNALAVACLARFGDGQGGGPGAVLRGIVTNPLILACLLGLLLNASGLGLPPILGPFLDILGRAALPVGLLAVGAGLSAGALRQGAGAVTVASAAKLLVLPLLVWALCALAGLGAMPTTVAVLYAALPCSASSYVLARRMGGDAPLVAGIITTQTMLSAATIPLLAVVLGIAAR